MDETTLALACRGDERAQEALIRAYQARIAGFVISQTGRDHFEDLCQNIFVKMVLALPRLSDREKFEPWLFTIARNVCRDHLRRQRWRRRLFTPLGDHDLPAPAAPKTTPELAPALAALPSADRELLTLQLQKQTYQTLATATGSSVAAVKSRLFRARAKLRALLGDE